MSGKFCQRKYAADFCLLANSTRRLLGYTLGRFLGICWSSLHRVRWGLLLGFGWVVWRRFWRLQISFQYVHAFDRLRGLNRFWRLFLNSVKISIAECLKIRSRTGMKTILTLSVLFALSVPVFGQVSVEEAKARLEAKKASTRPATTRATPQASDTELDRLRRIVSSLALENQKLKADNADLRVQYFKAAKLMAAKDDRLYKDVKAASSGIAVGDTLEDVKGYAKQKNYTLRAGSAFGEYTTYVIGESMYVTVDGAGKVTSAFAP